MKNYEIKSRIVLSTIKMAAPKISEKVAKIHDIQNAIADQKAKIAELVDKMTTENDTEAMIAYAFQLKDAKGSLDCMEKALESSKGALARFERLKTAFDAYVKPRLLRHPEIASGIPAAFLKARAGSIPKTVTPNAQTAPKTVRNWKMDFICANPNGVTARQIAEHGVSNGYLTGKTPEMTVRSDMRRVIDKGLAIVKDGKYYAC